MDEVSLLGPIRPEHAVDGWRLEGDDLGRWRLVKRFGDAVAMIVPTTSSPISWMILKGRKVVRAASEQDVETAKAHAAAWITKQQ